MELSYRKERDEDFLSICESIRKEYGKVYISMEDIAKKAVYQEAKSFYLNEKVYAIIIQNVRIGRLEYVRFNYKRELYMEIYNRYIKLKRENPSLTIMNCARIISDQKAPRFYISEGRAANLYYELIKK